MFRQGPSPGVVLSGLALLGLLVAIVYAKTDWLDPLKGKVVDFTSPFYWLAELPSEISTWGAGASRSRQELQEQNKILETQLLVHKRKLQKMASVVAENIRLRQLLNSADTLEDRVLVAELIGVSPDPAIHKIMLNRGSNDGAYVGQPVVDAFGLVGQVVTVGATASIVLLVSDTSHALPVQINRNGLRLVAEGRGNMYELGLRHVPSTMDIKEGDLLVSSGLGQRFPAGYPVAIVEKIIYDPGRPFIEVVAKPMAELNRNRHVLLVFESSEKRVVEGLLPEKTINKAQHEAKTDSDLEGASGE